MVPMCLAWPDRFGHGFTNDFGLVAVSVRTLVIESYSPVRATV